MRTDCRLSAAETELLEPAFSRELPPDREAGGIESRVAARGLQTGFAVRSSRRARLARVDFDFREEPMQHLGIGVVWLGLRSGWRPAEGRLFRQELNYTGKKQMSRHRQTSLDKNEE